MTQQKTILFVVNKASFFLSHRLLLALKAQQQGYCVHVATPFDEDVKKITENGFVHHSVPMNRSGSNPFQESRTLFILYSLYRTLKPDLIHHITIKPVLYGSIAARLANVAAIVNAIPGLGHVFTETGFMSSIRRNLVIFVYRVALKHKNMKVIFQNTENFNLFLSKRLVTSSNSILIKGSGVDLNEYYPVPEPETDVPLVILASRMLYDKGVSQFVDAARLINSDRPVARFALIGESDSGNPNSVPESVLRSWHDEGCIEWWGYREDMPEIFRMSNIVCLPTYYGEGVPKALIEAAASGRSIVATDIAGCREIVKNGQNGYLVKQQNVPDLAKAILNLINDPHLRKEMSVNGRKLVIQYFSSDKVIDETISVYQMLQNYIPHNSVQRRMIADAEAYDPRQFEKSLAGERLFITGGSGFIGTSLIKAIYNMAPVTVLSRKSSLPEINTGSDNLVITRGDLADHDSMPDDMLDNIDCIVHLASYVHKEVGKEVDQKHFTITEDGTRYLITKAVQAGVKKFIYISSIKAMGENTDALANEDSECRPESPYGLSKLAAEKLVLELGKKHGIHVCVLRLPMVYGAGNKGNLPRMIAQIDKNRFPPLPNLNNKRSMVHVDDVVQAILLAITKDGANGKTYIVTDGEFYSTRSIYEEIYKELKGKRPFLYIPVFVFTLLSRAGDIIGSLKGSPFVFNSDVYRKIFHSAYYSSDKIQKELGYKATKTFYTALPDLINEYRKCQ